MSKSYIYQPLTKEEYLFRFPPPQNLRGIFIHKIKNLPWRNILIGFIFLLGFILIFSAAKEFTNMKLLIKDLTSEKNRNLQVIKEKEFIIDKLKKDKEKLQKELQKYLNQIPTNSKTSSLENTNTSKISTTSQKIESKKNNFEPNDPKNSNDSKNNKGN